MVVLAKLIYEYIKARREVREARKDAMLTQNERVDGRRDN
jgi:hypothetical protein